MIAGAALAVSIISVTISLFGVIASWYQKGQASLTLHYERYPSVEPVSQNHNTRDARLVIHNVGPGDAYNVELTVWGYGEDLSGLLNGPRKYEWIPQGHSVHVPFIETFGGPPAQAGLVLYLHGRFATNPAVLRNRGKQNDLTEKVWKLPWFIQRFHRNRRMGFETPLTPHEIL